jgi:tetratricopeptide (TPR) repeat protein
MECGALRRLYDDGERNGEAVHAAQRRPGPALQSQGRNSRHKVQVPFAHPLHHRTDDAPKTTCVQSLIMSQETLSRAWEVLQDAYQAQMEGDYERAVELYQSSLDLYPTAEAHTFLGWTYHFQGRLDDAIAECKRAIEIDPEFGNPYNDIGAYLIEKNRFDEAIPWLERAVEAARYEPRHFPHYNLGRAYLGKEMYAKAIDCFQQALAIEPRYSLAREALDSLRRLVN